MLLEEHKAGLEKLEPMCHDDPQGVISQCQTYQQQIEASQVILKRLRDKLAGKNSSIPDVPEV